MAQNKTVTQNATILRAQALEAELNNQPDAAIALYDKALNLASLEYGPGSSYVGGLYVDLGNICMRSGKVQNAENYLRQALKCSPNSRLAKLKLAEVLALRGRDEASTQVLEQLVAKKPNELSARRALAMGFQQHGNFAKANREFALIQDVASGKRQAKQAHTSTPQPQATDAAPIEEGAPANTKEKSSSKDDGDKSSSQTESGIRSLIPGAKTTAKSAKPVEEPKKSPVKPIAPKPIPTKKAAPKPAPVKPAAPKQAPPKQVAPKPVAKPKAAPAVKQPVPDEASVEPISKPKPKPKKQPAKQAPEAQAGALNLKPTKPVKAGRGGLVPPPPPMAMPGYPMYAPTEPPPQAKPAAKPKPKPAPEKPSAPANQGSSEDADFLLDWAKKK